MSLLRLSLAYLRARALGAALNLVLLSLGVGMIVLLLLFGAQLETRLTRDARGIDLVVGAKGSPLQLILASVYHVDIPTGNIAYTEAERWAAHPLVETVIPLALGDSLSGFRIVGTTPAYARHYQAEPAAGRLATAPFEATLGATVAARTGLGVGDTFVGSHGLVGAGPAHDAHPYTVVGVLAPTASVVDRLVLTAVESAWLTHGIEVPTGDEDKAPPGRAPELTALLLTYTSPLAAVQLPPLVDQQPGLQAASPALESTRLLALIEGGLAALRLLGVLLIAVAGLSVFIALTNAMQERRYDLALMRLLGASRAVLLAQPLIEALLLAGAGALLGVGLAHLLAAALGAWLPAAQQLGLSGARWLPAEILVVGLTLAIALVAALAPAVQAYRTDIAKVLATRT